MAGFWNKLGRGLAAVSEGAVSDLPGIMNRRARREERSATRDEARIWKQFETDPGGAIQAATAAGNDKLEAALTGMRAGKERTGLQEKAGSLRTLTDITEQYEPRIGTAADRMASVGDVREQKERLIAGGGAFTTYAGSTSVGMGDPGRAALSDSEAAIEHLNKLEDQLTRPDLILRGIDAHMDPDMMAQRFFKFDAAMQALGLDPALSRHRVTALKKGFQRQRDDEFKVLLEPYVMAHRYDEARKLMVEMRVSLNMENYGEGLISAEEQRVSEDVTEAERFEAGQETLARADLHRQFRDLDKLAANPELYKSEALQLATAATKGGFPKLSNTIIRQYAERLRSLQAEGPEGLMRRMREDHAANPFQFSAAIPIFLGEPLDSTTQGGNKYASLEQLERYIALQIKLMYPDHDAQVSDREYDSIEAIAESVLKSFDQGINPDEILRQLDEAKRSLVDEAIARIQRARAGGPGVPRTGSLGPGGLFGDQIPPGGPRLLPRIQGPPVGEPTQDMPRSASPDVLGSSVNGGGDRIGAELPFLPPGRGAE